MYRNGAYDNTTSVPFIASIWYCYSMKAKAAFCCHKMKQKAIPRQTNKQSALLRQIV
jgi:hypothetical protein